MKGFLSQKNVEYTEKNIREDRAALLEILDRGFKATPVTLVDDEAMAGFDAEKLEALLGT